MAGINVNGIGRNPYADSYLTSAKNRRWSDCVCTGGKTRLRLLAEQTRQQRNQGDAHQSDTAASHELFHTQIGVGNWLDGGRRRVKKYLWSF